jgi:hypothetical protein
MRIVFVDGPKTWQNLDKIAEIDAFSVTDSENRKSITLIQKASQSNLLRIGEEGLNKSKSQWILQ